MSSDLGKTYRHVQTGVLGKVTAIDVDGTRVFVTVEALAHEAAGSPPFEIHSSVSHFDSGLVFTERVPGPSYLAPLRLEAMMFQAQWAEVL